MKKCLLIVLACLSFMTSVKAKAKVLTHFIDAEIEIAGALKIREMIVTEGTTDFLSRTINYKMTKEKWDQKTIHFNNSPIYNGYSLENVKVSAFKAPEKIDFDTFPLMINYFQNLDPKNPADESYTHIKNDLGGTYNIYKKTNNEKYIYYLEYLVSNVVVVHEDVLEINYSFKNLDLGATNTFIRVAIPYSTNNDKYNFWIHGPANTKLHELITPSAEKAGFQLQIPNLKSDINFRMTLPKEQVSIDLYLNHSGVQALNKIIQTENARITTNKVLKIIRVILIVTGVIYAFCSLVLLKYKKKIFFIVYLIFGLLIIFLNFIFKFNIWYLYLMITPPIILKLIGYQRGK